LTGFYNLTFYIYDDTTGGDLKWSETQNGVEVQNGLFNVILGKNNALNLSFDQYYWLAVKVGTETMPRVRFTSVGYAYRAQNADTAIHAIQVENYPHHHDADYVNVIGPDSIRTTGNSSYALTAKTYGIDARGLRIHTSGGRMTWGSDGIVIYTSEQWADGIYIDSTGDAGIDMQDVATNGVQMDDIHQDGVHMTDVAGDGIYMDDVAGDGIYLSDVEDNGIYINDAADNGLYVKKADFGIWIDSTRSGYDGIYIRYAEDDGIYISHADDEGVYVYDADGDGLYVYNASINGLYVHNADNNGLVVNWADNYGLYINDSGDDGIYVQSAVGNGIEAHGDQRGGNFYSGSAGHYGVSAHSYNNLSGNPGLYVTGYGIATGGFGKSVPGSSGEAIAFGVFSPDVELMASGTGTLLNGQAQINFKQEFQEAISTEVPVRVVVTAQDAPSALLYVTDKSTRGFTVKPLEIPELSLKSDDVSFDWIAIARQKGCEQRPQVIVEEEGSMADRIDREDALRAEEIKHQEERKQDELQRQQMLEKQTRREAKRREREKERQEQEGRDSE
jgi:hypothetical protein